MHITATAPAASGPAVPTRDAIAPESGSPVGSGVDPRFAQYKVIRRNGSVVGFEPMKITIAMTKAFLAVNGGQGAASARVRDEVTKLTDLVVGALMKRKPEGGAIHIEEIQDQVELALMRGGEHEVARAYVLYRERRSQERAAQKHAPQDEAPATIMVLDAGVRKALDLGRLTALVRTSCDGLADVDADRILKATLKDLYDGVPIDEVRKCVVLAARSLIEKDPHYSYVTARLLLDALRFEALGEEATQADMATKYAEYFPQFVKHGVKIGLLNEALLQYDMRKLGAALRPERDLQFGYLGLQTLYDRYFLVDQYAAHGNAGRRFELPQCFFMRVAMGLALNEVDREARAIEFYDVLSTFDFMSSTPTLFNSGTHRSQLSSCYLTTVSDDLDGIYEAIKENALLSKFAGGLGNDWTNVRAMGSHIKGTNGKSQGVVPFLKVVNDTAVAVNQGGKRKGAVCTYLETWHLDIEEFLELRKNTGDDRRRTHDMNTANWIPDLFMKRVMEGGDWTLFSPSDVPDLHDKWGKAFEDAYTKYEEKVARGELKLHKRIPALQLWRKMLSMLFETGHPWITFKDACNVRSPQQHVGTVHSSNLCTEITLNTSETEIAVCNLGSVNMLAHMKRQGDAWVLDHDKLKRTIRTAMRMLDNVIDINYYAVSKARNSNLKHRPVGLGIMGFQDCLHQLRVPYASKEAMDFADTAMEAVCYYAYWASTELAEERGRYASYRGSLWDRGILPQDSLKLLRDERGGYVEVDESSTMDWDALRARVREHGMRNSNCVAIAPTATISNIIGVAASIEPEYQNIYVKSNLSGEFTVVNEQLVRDLKERDLWDDVMVADLKYFDGSLAKIDRVPAELRSLYATAFEVDPTWIVEAGSRRQKWIDQ
ncbi:MAG TPA: ribonucleoside-diphosphate reductase subunit alpha, partial [Casimicrobiaceae bacterium]|nr:ribonucleoside-diphosphate reductase subunit alpha [Casimicrobiaceae bacterium]